MHQITIESITRLGEMEWREVIQAGSKAAATRKANKLISSCGTGVSITKRVNEFDAAIEIWQVK